jgi:hypothetical protein
MRRAIETLLILLLVPGFGWAKSSQNDWGNLKQLAPAQPIRIVLNGGSSYGGVFLSASDSAISVRLTTGEQTFERQNVLRLSTKGTSRRTRNALVGAAVGVGGALAIGGICHAKLNAEGYPNNHCLDAATIGPGAAIGGGIGAGIAALASKPRWHDVYRAR